MKQLLAGILLTLAAFAPAYAAPTGNNLHDMCSSPMTGELACSAFVSGFVFGMNGQANADDAMPLFCYPPDATLQQLADVFKKYLTDNPQDRHRPAVNLLVESMRKNWTCPESR
jgi:hypothetical protein